MPSRGHAVLARGRGLAVGLGSRAAVVLGLALALSATAIALQILDERGDLQSSYGQRSFAVLLFQDLSVIPLLALLPLLAGTGASTAAPCEPAQIGRRSALRIARGRAVGRYLLNPLFRLLAATGAREVMTAAALLLVLGTALLMQLPACRWRSAPSLPACCSPNSNFRHELEADIEPFRGILLGLFFMGVGMSIDAASGGGEPVAPRRRRVVGVIA